MTTRTFSFKKFGARLAAGGILLHAIGIGFGGGLGGCVSNAALTNFYTGVGHAVIDSAAANAGGIGADFDNIVVAPTAGFFRNLWTTVVDLNIPTDPTFGALLVE